MVFQDPRDQLVASTVGADVAFGPENLGLSHAEIDRRVADALAAVNMTGREDDRIASLSGGERERVAIAGVLSRWSPIISSWTSRSPGSTSRPGGRYSTACANSARPGRA